MTDPYSHMDDLLRAALSTTCSLDDRELAAMEADGRLAEHSARCAPCAERAAVLARIDAEPVRAAPAARAAMVARAQALMTQREDLLTVIVRWMKGAFDVLTGGEALIPAAAVSLRSLAEDVVHEPVSFRKRLGGLDLIVHLAPRSDERFDILLDPPGGPSHRYALLRGGKELFSEVSRGARVRFPEVAPGSYAIAVHTGADLVGRIVVTVHH
ncbi:MAG: hypothetical protein AMXMBFR64_43430 [Myxococcales bacterium]